MIPHDLEDRPLSERFDHLLEAVSGKRFLTLQGIGNEVPFFICPFHPIETLEMTDIIGSLLINLSQKGVKVERINLYDLCIDLIKKRKRVWPQIIEQETSKEKDRLLEEFHNILHPEDHLAPTIIKHLEDKEYDVLFIDGVGEVYPYVRTHALLGNLEKHLNTKPMILFFPGKYIQTLHSGASLMLFERLQDDKYYRAFNIYRYEP